MAVSRLLILRRVFDAALLVAVLVTVWRFVEAPRGRENAAEAAPVTRIALGSSLKIPGYGWSSRTVVLAIRTTCAACNADQPFYAALATRLAASSTALLILAPDSPTVMSSWLESRAIRATTRPQVDLAGMGIVATPTLAIVNSEGIVTDLLAGALSPEQETAVFQRLNGASTTPLNNTRYAALQTESQFQRLGATPGQIMLDVRSREAFAVGHRAGAVNIPHDELVVRAPIELPLSSPIAIDCLQTRFSTCEIAGERLIKAGAVIVTLLVPGGPLPAQ